MATITVTFFNWNDPAFWAGINPTGGDTRYGGSGWRRHKYDHPAVMACDEVTP